MNLPGSGRTFLLERNDILDIKVARLTNLENKEFFYLGLERTYGSNQEVEGTFETINLQMRKLVQGSKL